MIALPITFNSLNKNTRPYSGWSYQQSRLTGKILTGRGKDGL
jgi:hypothetical protein